MTDRIHVELGFEVISTKMSAIVLILGEQYGYILFDVTLTHQYVLYLTVMQE